MWRINNIVDSLNMISAKSLLPMGYIDHSTFKGEITIRTTNKELHPPDLKSKAPFRPIKFEEIKSKFYIRIELEDKPGNLGATTTILGKFKINIDEIIQSQSKIKSKSAPVVILTKNTEYIMVDKALKKISQAKLSKNKALVIPIEDFN